LKILHVNKQKRVIEATKERNPKIVTIMRPFFNELGRGESVVDSLLSGTIPWAMATIVARVLVD
jgi:hypothetical protein